MAKSKWKLLTIDRKTIRFILYNRVKKTNVASRQTVLKNFSRSLNLPNPLIGSNVLIHKGKIFKTLGVTKFNISYKTGEFSFTRKPFFFPVKEKKSKKR